MFRSASGPALGLLRNSARIPLGPLVFVFPGRHRLVKRIAERKRATLSAAAAAIFRELTGLHGFAAGFQRKRGNGGAVLVCSVPLEELEGSALK